MSHGTSRSRTDGTSESRTTGTSETEGTTRGTSQSRTAGTSETIQKRALITPDEIGQVFARIDDRARVAYPGLALAVISGARPVLLRRVHYYEDFQFMGLFDPHPDYPYAPPKELTVEGRTLGFSLAAFGLHLGAWSITAGEIAAPGDESALVVTANGTAAAPIRVPRGGKITAVEGATGGDVPEGRLFSLLYYEDGAEPADPFAELRAFCERVKASLEADRRAADQKRRNRRRGIIIALACCVLVAVIAIACRHKEHAAGTTRRNSAPTKPVRKLHADQFYRSYRDPRKAPVNAQGITSVPVCVPANVYNQSWENPPAGSKMEAFRSAIEKTIRDTASNLRPVNPDIEFVVLEQIRRVRSWRYQPIPRDASDDELARVPCQ